MYVLNCSTLVGFHQFEIACGILKCASQFNFDMEFKVACAEFKVTCAFLISYKFLSAAVYEAVANK